MKEFKTKLLLFYKEGTKAEMKTPYTHEELQIKIDLARENGKQLQVESIVEDETIVTEMGYFNMDGVAFHIIQEPMIQRKSEIMIAQPGMLR